MKKPPKRSGRPSAPPNRQVAALVYDGLCTFEFGIAVEMFGLPRPELADWYDFRLCAVDRGPMSAAGGMRVLADGGLEALASAGTIIVPGWTVTLAAAAGGALGDSLGPDGAAFAGEEGGAAGGVDGFPATPWRA